MNFRNKSVDVHQFAMIPRADIPRSSFVMEQGYKTTFDSGYLVPFYCEEVLPGDTFNVRATMFARLATPLQPFMDNLHLDTFFFFVPNRLTWQNWKKFNGEQTNPGDSVSYTIPQLVSAAGGFPVNSIFDYFGLPTVGQVNGASTVSINALPLRAYNLIFNEWFRDENLVNSLTVQTDNGPDVLANYSLQRRGKRPDYFTTALPWPQKGAAVSIPLGTSAPVYTSATTGLIPAQSTPINWRNVGTTTDATALRYMGTGGAAGQGAVGTSTSGGAFNSLNTVYPSNLYADLSAATAATINQLRQSFQIQKLLERDARGGTRYTEIVFVHFGVKSPDARLQRPEYLGGGSTPININPIAQTSVSAATPQGNLAAMGTALANGHGFTQSFTEHGYVIGIMNVRADLTYQQGLRKHWRRSTRYDYYWPVFAALGEQAVSSYEIYCDGQAADSDVFGYQERWAEYRYTPSQITGLFRSTSAGTIDTWHLAQRFTTRPLLNSTFIADTPPLQRVLAVASQTGKELLLDAVIRNRATRPMPLYSVPGLIDHF